MSEHTEKNMAGIDLGILLGDLLRVGRRLVWLCAALVVTFSAVLCLREYRAYRPSYQASATFTVYVANPLQSEVRSYNTATAEQMAKTFPYILTSGALKDMVMRDLEIGFMPAVSAKVLNNTNIFTLSVTSGDPQLSYDVLNSVIEHYPSVAEFVVGPTIMNLLDESGVPTAPINSRSYGGAVKKGAVLGVAVWLAVLVALAMLRSTVHNEEELKRLTNLRCLGVLPAIKGLHKRPEGAYPLLSEKSGHFGFGESVRLMRIRVEKELREQNMQVLLVSSATPGEGKTTVAINLATALALKGKRTLLIDCDLRNPSVAKSLGKENKCGLVDFLNGDIPAQKALHQMENPNLYVTFAGGSLDNAAEMLAREENKAFLAACREIFDYIILDTPPSSLMADASEIACIAHGALMTIRQHYAPKAQILEGVQLLSDSGLPLIGCVFNGVSGGVLGGYGGYYGQSYSRYYKDYGENGESGEV